VHSIGVTGTDGKSTVTWLISQSLAELLPHYHVHATGNWDDALSKTILDILTSNQESEHHVFVIECSSFMLYPTKKYHFDIGVWTNFAPDHLNWHPDMGEYFAAKQKIITQSDLAYTSKTIFEQLSPELQHKTRIYATSYDLSTTQFIGDHNEKNCALTFDVVKVFCEQINSIRNDEEIRHAI
jgi:UDP-N-acetylmuramoylalanine--D-glutamate ligase